MMAGADVDTVIIGSGVAGVTVAAELLAHGRSVTMLERGSFVPWSRQVKTLAWESDAVTAAHNHESDTGEGEDWPWTYVYGVGGTCARWAGAAPRLIPEDFEMRSRFGVMRDWPVSYDDLRPHYERVERVLGVAGPAASDVYPPPAYALPPHPLSPGDRLVAPLLGPFVALPQARPTRAVGQRPPCCGSARCQLCPVDSRFSVQNGMAATLEHPSLDLHRETIAARLVSDPSRRRISGVECVRADGSRTTIRGRRYVVAANGIESAGLLLRSDIRTPETGQNLYDHANGRISVTLRRRSGAGHGRSLSTGASYRYYRGEFRRSRAAVLLDLVNTGPIFEMPAYTAEAIMAGRSGRALRREVADRFLRVLSFDVYLDDVPNRRNRVELSPTKDRFGLPRNRVVYRRATAYAERGLAHVLDDLPRALAELGVESSRFEPTPLGGHMIGTLRMGEDDGAVVDADLRHRLRENLYVAGSSVFPTPSPANPTLTLTALAHRLGRHLVA